MKRLLLHIQQPVHGVVYLITNKVNGKYYVGKTKNSLLDRWYEHQWDANHADTRNVCKAIRRYGVQHFTIERLCECSSPATLDATEIFFIQFLGSWKSSFGYNMTMGGDGGAQTESVVEQIKATLAVTWADPALRAEQSRKLVEFYSTPIGIALATERAAKRWADPKERVKQAARVQISHNKLEFKENMSIKLTKVFADPKFHAEFCKKMKAVHSTPEARAANSARSKIAQNKPDVREAKSKQSKLQQSTPEALEANRKRGKEKFEDPEYKAYHLARCRAYYAEKKGALV